MCGIVGYIGPKVAAEVILSGLRLLEYRGYDSAGIATVHAGQVHLRRREGKLERLAQLLSAEPLPGQLGVGHTRWATHGVPAERNAHPHQVGDVVVVHNGIIENYQPLKDELSAAGRHFSSETDSEVIAHLIALALDDPRPSAPTGLDQPSSPLLAAVQAALGRLRGSFAIAVTCARLPGELVVARQSSPLVLGVAEGESFAASDIPALLEHTRRIIFLEDGDVARLTAGGHEIYGVRAGHRPADATPWHPQGSETAGASAPAPMGAASRTWQLLSAAQRPVRTISWSPLMAQKEGHKHFMHKEIFEQPRAVADTLRGRLLDASGPAAAPTADVSLDGFPLAALAAESCARVVFVACGTSYHAGLLGRQLLERLARVPAAAELASELRYAEPLIGPSELVVAISQSGETADTLAAVEEVKRRGARVLALTNVLESSLARAATWTLYTHAGPEIGVASTKAFTTQLAALYLLAIAAGAARQTLPAERRAALLDGLRRVPAALEQALALEPAVAAAARRFADAKGFLFLGRGLSYPIALEGALKLKEISYIHAEGYPAGEMKHGPIALVEPAVPTVVVDAGDHTTEKLLSNIQEIKARQGTVLVVGPGLTGPGPTASPLAAVADVALSLPALDPLLMPLVACLPLQLFAYHIADHRGTDVDQPRNLAKSVTVE